MTDNQKSPSVPSTGSWGKLLILGVGLLALFAGSVLLRMRAERRSNSTPIQTHAATSERAGAPFTTTTYRAAAKELVKQRLRDPGSAEFTNVAVITRPGRATVVCGRFNARNGFGGMTGASRFIVGNVVVLEDELGTAGMDQLWATSC